MSTTSGPGRRVGLDADDVVAAAVEIVEREGPEHLTMRHLAAELDVSVNTIYWHIGGRDELIEAMIESRRHRLSESVVEGDGPQERVAAAALRVFDETRRHPNLSRLAYETGHMAALQLPLEVALARELTAAGLHGIVARDLMRALLYTVGGFLVLALRADEQGRERYSESFWTDDVPEGVDESLAKALATRPDLELLLDATVRALVDARL